MKFSKHLIVKFEHEKFFSIAGLMRLDGRQPNSSDGVLILMINR